MYIKYQFCVWLLHVFVEVVIDSFCLNYTNNPKLVKHYTCQYSLFVIFDIYSVEIDLIDEHFCYIYVLMVLDMIFLDNFFLEKIQFNDKV